MEFVKCINNWGSCISGHIIVTYLVTKNLTPSYKCVCVVTESDSGDNSDSKGKLWYKSIH